MICENTVLLEKLHFSASLKETFFLLLPTPHPPTPPVASIPFPPCCQLKWTVRAWIKIQTGLRTLLRRQRLVDFDLILFATLWCMELSDKEVFKKKKNSPELSALTSPVMNYRENKRVITLTTNIYICFFFIRVPESMYSYQDASSWEACRKTDPMAHVELGFRKYILTIPVLIWCWQDTVLLIYFKEENPVVLTGMIFPWREDFLGKNASMFNFSHFIKTYQGWKKKGNLLKKRQCFKEC